MGHTEAGNAAGADPFNIYRLSTSSVSQALLRAMLQLCSEEAAGMGMCGQGQTGGSPGAPRVGCVPISHSWLAACPVGC